MAREINLVPSSKFEAIKAIRLRNFLLFLCIAVAGGAIAVVFVLGTIVGGQNLALGGKDNMLKLYSEKINSYTELSDFLTIKDQLGKLQTLAEKKNVISRTFNLLPVFIPTNGDEVKFEKVGLSFEGGGEVSDEEGYEAAEGVYLTIQAQANALTEPFIDYNVLDSFKKAMDYYRYDFGTYVNELGQVIPSYCIIENDSDGSFFNDDGKYYAYWTVKADGCDPRHPVDLLASDEDTEELDEVDDETEEEMQYELMGYDGQDVVKVWRTPQFKDWYDDEKMSLDGTIEGIPHFESSCISYSGNIDEVSGVPYFTSENESCLLVVGGVNGFNIRQSGNGRDTEDDLILSFEGTIVIDPAFFRFQNTHMNVIAPSGRYNVTDSYTQVQSLFVPPAEACEIDDIECRNGGK